MENQFLSDTQMRTALVIGQLEPAFVEQLIINLNRINLYNSADCLFCDSRYSTKHLNDETTPKNIKGLLV